MVIKINCSSAAYECNPSPINGTVKPVVAIASSPAFTVGGGNGIPSSPGKNSCVSTNLCNLGGSVQWQRTENTVQQNNILAVCGCWIRE